ncbi:MAG: hypothetical protein R6U55_03130, partial [Desulfovermiculus sp.]
IFKEMYGHVFKNNTQFYALWDSWELSHIDTSWNKPHGRYSYEYYWENNMVKQGSVLMSLDGDMRVGHASTALQINQHQFFNYKHSTLSRQ